MARIPIDIGSGKIKEQNIIVGIDLGTTNSLIARMVEGVPQAIADYNKAVIVPSIVHFGASGNLIVGEDAAPYLSVEPLNTIYSVKRLMGRAYADVSEHLEYFNYKLLPDTVARLARIQIQDKTYTPVEISAFILRELKVRAEHRLKTPIYQAVITVPAYFNDAQRQATRDAGKLAGLDVLRIINEPTAAALAYGLNMEPDTEKTIVVYDLGGGTFDVTILRLHDGIFDVLATNGDTYLGGDDFDHAIVLHWCAQQSISLDALSTEDRQQLRLLAETAKRAMNTESLFQANSKIGKIHYNFTLTQSDFDTIAMPYIQRTLDCCQKALKDADCKLDALQDVILVGGSTRMQIVKKAVSNYFKHSKVHDYLNPDEVVALGAAIQADILAGNQKGLLLLDVTPLSLGVETVGGVIDVIIPRNSRIPTRVARMYTTSIDGQVNMRISVYQGERELAADNRKLAEFDLKGIPAMPAGLPKVEISFLLDTDGILKVQAKELRSGVVQEITVKPMYGLSDIEVEQMLQISLENAQADMQRRLLAEARAKAKQMIFYAEKFIEKNQMMLSEDVQNKIKTHIQNIKATILKNSTEEINLAIDALEDYTRPFAEQVLDHAVRSAIVGEKI